MCFFNIFSKRSVNFKRTFWVSLILLNKIMKKTKKIRPKIFFVCFGRIEDTKKGWGRISSTLEFALFSSRYSSMILRLDKKDHWNSGNQHIAELFQVWDHRTLGNHSTQWNHIVRSSEQIHQSTYPGICARLKAFKMKSSDSGNYSLS